MTDLGLAAMPLFQGCDPADLAALASRLVPRELQAGQVLMRQDEPGRFFAIVVDGHLAVTRDSRRGIEQIAEVGPGSVLGELALLGVAPRSATVSALSSCTVLCGDAAAFEALLDTHGTQDPIRRLVSTRLAENARVIPTQLRSDALVLVRPLLASDRGNFAAALQDMSAKSLRQRFFTAGQPSDRAINYLVELDYVNHFAWVVLDAQASHEGLAEGRYVRAQDAHDEAEVAFTVSDAYQGQGLGTLLLGALAVAAAGAGICRFTAWFLTENVAVRSILAKAGAEFSTEGLGQISASLLVRDAQRLIPSELRVALTAAAHDIVTAAGLALTGPSG